MYKAFLIKYGEIGVKGKNRYLFEDALVRQIRYALKEVDGEFNVTKENGRIYATAVSDFDYDEAVAALKRVFGIIGICPVVQIEDNGFDDLAKHVVEYFDATYPDKNITFITDIRSKTVSFISPDDCTSLFCNLLDNAYEAACKTDDGHITLKICSDTSDKLTIMVNVVNSCNGNPFDSHGKLKTSKKDTISHGYGLKSIERVVNKYNGFIDMYYDENDSTFHTLISFSDRM